MFWFRLETSAKTVVGCVFLVGAGRFKDEFHIIKDDLKGIQSGNCLLELEPPKATASVDKTRNNEKCPGHPVPFQDWPCVIEVVSITVVERKRREGPRRSLDFKSCRHFVQGHDVKSVFIE